MWKNKVSTKLIGVFMLLPAILIFLGIVFAVLMLTPFGLASGVTTFQLLPFLFVMFLGACISAFSIFVALRYFKNNPFEQNESLGIVLVVGSVVYLVYNSFTILISNLTGNEGGYLKVLIALLFLLIFLPFGLGLKNGYK